MFNLKGFGCIVLATTTIATVTAETHCPANVASVPYHLVNRYQMIIEVSINHRGPYSFLLDTGAQSTVIEPVLAVQLQLVRSARSIRVVDGNWDDQTVLVRPAEIEVGPYSVQGTLAAVENLGQLQLLDPKIRGILGATFFANFDLLLDQPHRILCLEERGQMAPNIRGERIPFISVPGAQRGSSFPAPALIAVRLSDETSRGVTMMLDSGANVPRVGGWEAGKVHPPP